MQKNKNKIIPTGFSKITILIVVLVVIAGGGLAWQFWPEPAVKQQPAEQEQPETEQPIVDEVVDETADWQTYRNEEWGFEMKYPQQLVSEIDNIYDPAVFAIRLYLDEDKIFSNRIFSLSIYGIGGMGGQVCMYAIEGFSEEISIDGEQGFYCRQSNQKSGKPSYFPTTWVEREGRTYVFMGEGGMFNQMLSTFKFILE